MFGAGLRRKKGKRVKMGEGRHRRWSSFSLEGRREGDRAGTNSTSSGMASIKIWEGVLRRIGPWMREVEKRAQGIKSRNGSVTVEPTGGEAGCCQTARKGKASSKCKSKLSGRGDVLQQLPSRARPAEEERIGRTAA